MQSFPSPIDEVIGRYSPKEQEFTYFDNGKKKIHWSHPKYIEKKRENKSYEAFQQAVLLCYLNQFCAITLEKRRRQPTVTMSLPNIKALIFEKEEVDISSLAEQHCRQNFDDYHFEGKNKQTTTRRLEKNKRIFIHNLLIDILIEKGYFFDSKMSKRSKRGFQLERIIHIFYKNKFIMGKEDLTIRGCNVNSYLCKLVESTSIVTIPRNDLCLYQAFNQ
ncbi:hypothetical protein EDI_070780 [Entamoeba dispar SAW760]|uniref:Uncharacterized protein n=1 Tax=Entamoeba dispar (strain ATCC PRA-260 / SAW760) TaxID=370354 RepID=B0EMB8_ENTDS|nr:uncharacterized protein EDI_070780 [Entamoeba dispar SAW760]EDR24336.1 hypothetical protein EDI_070780 [Entamoeba dispar SAW760]|eukprot:EDR24336.1 hypothetical protein EDI_070780 [Entamoeba dispar SAW760]